MRVATVRRQPGLIRCAFAGLCIAASAQAGTPAAHWAPHAISSPLFESHGAFDPARNDFYFVRSSRDFRGWRIMVSHCGSQGWETPIDASFAGDGVEADPFITPDGKQLYFISTRSTDGQRHKDLDIWRVDRQADGKWGEPRRLPEPVNSRGQEWFPRPAADGWLYFGSDRPGGFGKTDIWRARQDANGKWKVENAGAAINTAGDEYEPLPSPDGNRMIVMASDGLYMTKLENGRWTPKTKLGPDVNVNGTEIGAAFSPSGKSLLFSRDTKGPLSGEFFLWQPDGPEAWPPVCRDQHTGPRAEHKGGDASVFLRDQNPQQDVDEDARKACRENRDQHITDSGQTGIETEVIRQATDDAGDDAVTAGAAKRT